MVFLQGCLVMDPAGRMTCEELMDHSYFDHFRDWFQPELEVCSYCMLRTCCVVSLIAQEDSNVLVGRLSCEWFPMKTYTTASVHVTTVNLLA